MFNQIILDLSIVCLSFLAFFPPYILKTQVHNNYRFPIVASDYQYHRLNEKRNNTLIKNKPLPDAAIAGNADT